MPLEQRLGGAEFGEDLLFVHRLLFRSAAAGGLIGCEKGGFKAIQEP